MTINETDNPVNPKSIAAYLAAEYKRIGLDWRTQISVHTTTSGTRWSCYGSHDDPIGFVNEQADTLAEAVAQYRAATDPSAVATKLRTEAAELVKKAAKMEGAQ